MELLPDEIIIETLGYLEADDLCSAALVNRRFYEIAKSNFIWKQVFTRRWSMEPSSSGNLKEFYASLNCRVTREINQYQAEKEKLRELLAIEKKRQLDNLNQRIQEKKDRRFIKELEML